MPRRRGNTTRCVCVWEDVTVLPGSISLAWFHLSPRILHHPRVTLRKPLLMNTSHRVTQINKNIEMTRKQNSQRCMNTKRKLTDSAIIIVTKTTIWNPVLISFSISFIFYFFLHVVFHTSPNMGWGLTVTWLNPGTVVGIIHCHLWGDIFF